MLITALKNKCRQARAGPEAPGSAQIRKREKPLSSLYQFQPGDHLSAIASKFGLLDYHTIWNHPKNAALKSKRKFPGVLFPGDTLFIPDKQDSPASRGTDQRHQFVIKRQAVKLTLVLDTVDQSPVDSAPTRLLQESVRIEKTTDGSGKVQFDLTQTGGSPALQVGGDKVTGGLWRIPLVIAELFDLAQEPFDAADAKKADLQKGAWRDRFNNMGYYAGYEAKDEEHFRWAVEEFQCDHVYPGDPKQINGQCDAKTRDTMQKVYGC